MIILTLLTGLCLATWCRGTGRGRRSAPVLRGCTIWLQTIRSHIGVPPSPGEVLSTKFSVMEMFGHYLPVHRCVLPAHCGPGLLSLGGSQGRVRCSHCPGGAHRPLGRTDGSVGDDNTGWSVLWRRDTLWSCPPQPHTLSSDLGVSSSWNAPLPLLCSEIPSLFQDWLSYHLLWEDFLDTQHPLSCWGPPSVLCSSCPSLPARTSVTALSLSSTGLCPSWVGTQVSNILTSMCSGSLLFFFFK